jgi:hypothetical protein
VIASVVCAAWASPSARTGTRCDVPFRCTLIFFCGGSVVCTSEWRARSIAPGENHINCAPSEPVCRGGLVPAVPAERSRSAGRTDLRVSAVVGGRGACFRVQQAGYTAVARCRVPWVGVQVGYLSIRGN